MGASALSSLSALQRVARSLARLKREALRGDHCRVDVGRELLPNMSKDDRSVRAVFGNEIVVLLCLMITFEKMLQPPDIWLSLQNAWSLPWRRSFGKIGPNHTYMLG